MNDERYWSLGEILLVAGHFNPPPERVYNWLMDLDFYMEMRRRADLYKIKPWVFNSCMVGEVRKAILQE